MFEIVLMLLFILYYTMQFQKIFNKPNKEAMEQVLYYLLLLTDSNCFKTVPWPITTYKEAAEFRNAATLIINVSLYLFI